MNLQQFKACKYIFSALANGPCPIPEIPNGKVVASADYLQSGEKLVVKCDSGYVRIGMIILIIFVNVRQ